MKMKYKVCLILIALSLVGCLCITQSYALWVIKKEQTKQNVIESGCFSVGFNDGNGSSSIDLQNTYPVSDTVGLNNPTPYTFTITNTCTVKAKYVVTLNTLTTNTLTDDFIKFGIHYGTQAKPSVGVNLKEFGQTPANINKETSDLNIPALQQSYILATGELAPAASSGANGGQQTYKLYLWMDEKATTEQKNKTFESIVKVKSVAIKNS